MILSKKIRFENVIDLVVGRMFFYLSKLLQLFSVSALCACLGEIVLVNILVQTRRLLLISSRCLH